MFALLNAVATRLVLRLFLLAFLSEVSLAYRKESFLLKVVSNLLETI